MVWFISNRVNLENAYSTNIKGLSLGLDLITQKIVIKAYKTILHIFLSVYSILLNKSYYPEY